MGTTQPDALGAVEDLFRGPGVQTGGTGGSGRGTIDPRRRRRRRLIGGLTTAVVLLVIVGLVAAYVVASLNAPLAAPASAVQKPVVTLPAAASVPMPNGEQSAISVAGADEYLGASASGVWQTGGDGSAVPIASISKIVTALVVLNAKPLGASGNGPTITFSKADNALYDVYYQQNATIAPMPTGSSMTEHDAIETMLVASACNYAAVLANWAFGSQAGFVSAAKSWLAKNGMPHTRLVEPTGLDAHNVSTASDLVALGKLAMANPAIAAIVAQTHTEVPGLDPMYNTNDLLGTDGVDGIKTGTLDPYGSNLLFSAKLDVGLKAPVTVIGAILGGGSHGVVDQQAADMLEGLTAGFHRVSLAHEGDVVGTYSTPWGAKAKMELKSGATLFTWSNTPITVTMSPMRLGSGAAGEKLGTVTWKSGADSAGADVVLANAVKQPTQWWRLTHPHQVLGW